MALMQLERPQWQPYFDRLSQALGGARRARVEVVALRLGDQVEGENLALFGFSYDPAKDAFTVAAEGVEHTISRPREIPLTKMPNGFTASR